MPVLLDWLPRVENLSVKATLARALADPLAKPDAAVPALREYRRVPVDVHDGNLAKESLAVCVKETATAEAFDELAATVREPGHGESRRILVEVLAGMKKEPRAVDVALELLDDEEVAPSAVYVLGRLGDERARPALEKLREHPELGDPARAALERL